MLSDFWFHSKWGRAQSEINIENLGEGGSPNQDFLNHEPTHHKVFDFKFRLRSPLRVAMVLEKRLSLKEPTGILTSETIS